MWVLCMSNVDEQGSKPASWYKFFWIFAQTASHAPQSNTTSTSRRRRRRSRYRLCTYRESSVIVFCSVERLRVAKSSKGLAEIGKRPNSTPVLFLASRSSLLNASSPSILPFFFFLFFFFRFRQLALCARTCRIFVGGETRKQTIISRT